MSETKTFKALSLWQPHAAAIRLGLKPYETRSWPIHYRGPLVICSSLKPFKHTDYTIDYYNDVARRMKAADCPLYALQYGIAECIATVADCVLTSNLRGNIPRDHEFWGDFTDGTSVRYAFRLTNIHPIPHRVPVKGRQRFFDVELPIGDCGEYA